LPGFQEAREREAPAKHGWITESAKNKISDVKMSAGKVGLKYFMMKSFSDFFIWMRFENAPFNLCF